MPQPGLNAVRQLVDQVRAAGLPVKIDIEGEAVPLAPGVDLSAYRILQEALTNAIKHAGPASAEVRVAYRANEVELEVIDDGRGSNGTHQHGHGLIGMQERVELYGGRLEPARTRRRLARARLVTAGGRVIRVAGRRRPGPRARRASRMILDAEPDIEVVGEAADGRAAVEPRRAGATPTSC